jgi:Zn-finger nucleic acid-binding protein
MSERSGIEIDYCPQCRGVWLDRGELDKIIERSFGAAPAQPAPAQQPAVPAQPAYPAQPAQQGYQQQQGFNPRELFGTGQGTDQYGRKRKKESWLSELFD